MIQLSRLQKIPVEEAFHILFMVFCLCFVMRIKNALAGMICPGYALSMQEICLHFLFLSIKKQQ